ncbi:MAG: tyrosine-type recombinase/integrase [Anaerolineae bacterium]|nr:tyrosine-type recombinase/integrase [Anaerolineae bacterium]
MAIYTANNPNLIGKDRAPATINRALVSISKLAKWCVAQDLCKDNFATNVKAVQVVKPGPQALSDVERDRLMRAAIKDGNVRDIAVIVTLAYAGLRVAELCNLKRRDVTMSDRKGELKVHGNGEKFRMVPLVREVRAALAVYLEMQTDHDMFLFIGQRGPLTDAGAYEIVKKYSAVAKIECHPHTLRHGFATTYLRNNPSDLEGLAQLLGHESLDTTDRYTMPTTQELAERMEAQCRIHVSKQNP